MPLEPNVSTAVAVVVALATPATLAVSYSAVTGDPTYRPLGLTREQAVRASAATGDTVITAELHWTGQGRLEDIEVYAQAIDTAFLSKGTDAWVVLLSDTVAQESYVIYRIGATEIGPLPLDEAARGVRPALDALQMMRRAKRLPEEVNS